MVKIKNFNGNEGHPVILEDPRSGVDGLYFWGQKVNKQTLAPEFDNMLSGKPVGSKWWYFELYMGIRNFATYGYYPQMHLMLRKHTVQNHWPSTESGNGTLTYGSPDPNPWFFIDENDMHGGGAWDMTSGGTKSVFMHNMSYGQNSSISRWGSLQDTQSMMDGLQNDPLDMSTRVQWMFPVGIENSRVVGIHRGHSSGALTYNYPSWEWFSMGAAWPGNYGTITYSTTNAGNNYNWSYIGTGGDGNHRFQRFHSDNPGHVSIWKVVWSATTPTLTHVYNGNSNPGTGGTHYGGAFNNGTHVQLGPSKMFTDPRDASKKIWYQPYFDTNSRYHPQIILWETDNDTFTRETDISTNVLSDVHVDYSSYLTLTGTNQYTCIYNETFVSGGNRYISLISIATYNKTAGESPQKIITYGINSANPKTFTYHSVLDVGASIHNVVWLNDSRTMMACLLNNSAKIYSWNNTSGWGLTTTIGQHVLSMGRDSLDRIWYCTPSTRHGSENIDIHLLSPTLPVTITVSPELTQYNYAGSTITSYLNISALNASGNRIATTVKVALEGASMTFSDDTVVKEITTSSSGETQANIKVTGAGFVNITASVVI